jgi:predicted Na+-dependent transporter
MKMSEILAVIMNLSVLIFVISSMLSMGLSLTVAEILAPLRKTRLVVLALVANFIIAPLAAYLILLVIPLEQGLRTGLIIMATAAGAPFLPKLVQAAKGDVAFSVGLMVLLMIATIIYLPIVLPLLLQGVEVNPMDIAKSLVVMMLIPLAAGLFIKTRYEDIGKSLYPSMNQASSLGLILLLVSGVVVNYETILGVIGTGGILAIFIFLGITLIAGYLLGGNQANFRSVVGLGTAQRNISAAFLVAVGNFSEDPNVLAIIMVAGLIGLIALMVIAGEIGRHNYEATK